MLNENDRIIINDGYMYVYCPACDELHSVPLKPQHVDGWRVLPVVFCESGFKKPSDMTDNPSVTEFPTMDHCAHSTSSRFSVCAWILGGYYVGNDRTTIVPSIGYIHHVSGHGQSGYQPMRTIAEWPERFKKMAEALTRNDK